MKEQFSVITMKTKNNKVIYLGEQGSLLGWTFDYNEALWFNTNDEAESFARDYFKNFKDWEIKTIEYTIY